MPAREWNRMCREVFGCHPDYVDLDTVLSRILETDTVGTLSSPIDVWIDDDGYFTVDVHEQRAEGGAP